MVKSTYYQRNGVLQMSFYEHYIFHNIIHLLNKQQQQAIFPVPLRDCALGDCRVRLIVEPTLGRRVINKIFETSSRHTFWRRCLPADLSLPGITSLGLSRYCRLNAMPVNGFCRGVTRIILNNKHFNSSLRCSLRTSLGSLPSPRNDFELFVCCLSASP